MKYNVVKGNEVVKKNLSKKQAEEYCDKMNKEFKDKQESIRKQQHNAGTPLRKSKYELYKVEVVKESKTVRLSESQLTTIIENIVDEVLNISKDPQNDTLKMVQDYEGGQYKWFNNDYSHIKTNNIDAQLKKALYIYRVFYGDTLKRVIAKDDDIPVGYLIYTKRSYSSFDDIGDGETYPVICSTAVNPEYRNQGILRGMIQKSGIGDPFLVHSSYLSPPNLWEKFGCKPVKDLEGEGNQILKCE